MKRTLGIKYLLLALLIALLAVIIVINTSSIEQNSYYELQLSASTRMEEAELYLKSEIVKKGIDIEVDDLNQTGLLGPEFTELTSTPGNLGAKRTSLNPNFAAAMVKWYKDAGLKSGDTIAIGTSGSFPGLLIASLCAAKEMDLYVKIIASLGASMHGATRVDFYIFDFLYFLKEGGFADFELLAVSPGGDEDKGGATLEGVIFFGTKELAKVLCNEVGVEVLLYDDIDKNIQRRLALYGDDISLFVNIGGASPNCGTSAYTLNFPQGLVLNPPRIPSNADRGLNYEYAARGIPVLNLLNVRKLAEENGIAYDPVPMEKVGVGGVYYRTSYNRGIIILSLVCIVSVIVYGYHVAKRKEA